MWAAVSGLAVWQIAALWVLAVVGLAGGCVVLYALGMFNDNPRG